MAEIGGEIVGGRIQLRRDEAAKRPLVQRLNRIEGQVRGLRGMIEEDRYCLDEIQQINAIAAALREVALAITAEHVAVGVRLAAPSASDGAGTGGTGTGGTAEAAVEDVMRVLRAAMRRDG